MLMELYDALMSAGASETKAKAAAAAVPHGKELCTKQYLDNGLAEVRAELRADMKVLKFAVFQYVSVYPRPGYQNIFSDLSDLLLFGFKNHSQSLFEKFTVPVRQ